MTPTRKTIDTFLASLTPGTVVQCLQNTAIPQKIGTSGSVIRAGKTRVHISVGGDRAFTLCPPSRVSDYREVTADSITYVILTGYGESTVQWVKCGCDAAATGEGHRIGCPVVLAGLKNLHAPVAS